MKYVVKELWTGKYAVGFGRRYFPDTITEDRSLAFEQAMVKNIGHYDELKRKAFSRLCVANGGESTDDEVQMHDGSVVDLGDLTC